MMSATGPRLRPRRLMGDRQGAAIVEFGLIAMPLLILVFGVMELGYDLYVQVALDFAAEQAARGVQVGVQQGSAGESSAKFAAASVCPALTGLLSCNAVVVGVRPIPAGYNYYTNPAPLTLAAATSPGGAICTGTGGQLMLIQLWYAGPTFAGALIPGFSSLYNGALVHFTAATAGFVNEAFSGGQSTGSGC